MQLMIDIQTETPAALRLAAQFLNNHAQLREAIEQSAPPAPVHAPAPVKNNVVDFPLFDPADLDRAKRDMDDDDTPAPFIPPAPTAIAEPSSVQTLTTGAGGNVGVPYPAPSAVIPTAPPAAVGVTPDEFDSTGVPFDTRIHQKSRNKKKDGTWKIQKGLDAAIVSAVMQELAPRIRAPLSAASTPAPVGAAAPVTLPPTIPVPPAPVIPQAPAQSQAVSIPTPPPSQQAAPTSEAQAPAQATPADAFRALARKIVTAQRESKITTEEVSKALADAGAPSLQLLNNLPHLIPTVEFNIDLILATR